MFSSCCAADNTLDALGAGVGIFGMVASVDGLLDVIRAVSTVYTRMACTVSNNKGKACCSTNPASCAGMESVTGDDDDGDDDTSNGACISDVSCDNMTS